MCGEDPRQPCEFPNNKTLFGVETTILSGGEGGGLNFSTSPIRFPDWLENDFQATRLHISNFVTVATDRSDVR